MIPRRTTTLFMALGIVACSDSTSPPASPPTPRNPSLQTDRLEYVLTEFPFVWETELVVTYENKNPRTVYLPGCLPEGTVEPQYDFVRAEPDTGRVFFTKAWACVGGVPALPIAPGTARVDTVVFVSSDSPGAQPPVQPHERVGLMRVIYRIYGSTTPEGEADWGDPLPIENRRSNVFRIRFEDEL